MHTIVNCVKNINKLYTTICCIQTNINNINKIINYITITVQAVDGARGKVLAYHTNG